MDFWEFQHSSDFFPHQTYVLIRKELFMFRCLSIDQQASNPCFKIDQSYPPRPSQFCVFFNFGKWQHWVTLTCKWNVRLGPSWTERGLGECTFYLLISKLPLTRGKYTHTRYCTILREDTNYTS